MDFNATCLDSFIYNNQRQRDFHKLKPLSFMGMWQNREVRIYRMRHASATDMIFLVWKLKQNGILRKE